MLVSNLGRDTGNLDRKFPGFSSTPPCMGTSTSLQTDALCHSALYDLSVTPVGVKDIADRDIDARITIKSNRK
jgi:hypothetical protein